MTALEALATLCWRQRELLDLLLFKAGFKQYVVMTDQMRWLPRIGTEIEQVLTDLNALEGERLALVEQIVAEQNLPTPSPSLREIAEAVGDPWGTVLMQHHEALLLAVTEIRALSETNRDLIERGMSAVREALAIPHAPTGTYTATGQSETSTQRAVALDGVL